MQGERSDNPSRGRILARVAGVGALLVGVVLVAIVLFGGDSGHKYKLLFETGGQLVPGNQVLVGGQPIGTVDEISLTEDAQAEVEITVDEPLHEGPRRSIRATSLSGIANRYVSIAPGPNSEPEIADDATITGGQDHLAGRPRPALRHPRRPRRAQGLQDFIQGQAAVYTGNNEAARATYKYFAPEPAVDASGCSPS